MSAVRARTWDAQMRNAARWRDLEQSPPVQIPWPRDFAVDAGRKNERLRVSNAPDEAIQTSFLGLLSEACKEKDCGQNHILALPFSAANHLPDTRVSRAGQAAAVQA